MPQILKVEVRDRIVAAAEQVFLESGYVGATMNRIAARAELSAGNVYRYFDSKAALYKAVVDDAFVARFDALLDARVAALSVLPDLRTLDASATDRQTELLAFWLEHRTRVVILLDRCDGTPHDGFGARFVARLVEHTLAHLQSAAPGPLPDHVRPVLSSIFDGTRRTLVALLEHQPASDVRAAFATFWTYQLAGLAGLHDEVTR